MTFRKAGSPLFLWGPPPELGKGSVPWGGDCEMKGGRRSYSEQQKGGKPGVGVWPIISAQEKVSSIHRHCNPQGSCFVLNLGSPLCRKNGHAMGWLTTQWWTKVIPSGVTFSIHVAQDGEGGKASSSFPRTDLSRRTKLQVPLCVRNCTLPIGSLL